MALVVTAFESVARAEYLDCKEMYAKLYAHSQKALDAQQKFTDYPYWGRARLAISAADAKDIDAIFSKMSFKDMENLFWGVKGGDIKVTREEEKMVEELWQMVHDLTPYGDPFWGKHPDRTYAIQKALQAHDAKMTYSGAPEYAAQMSSKALDLTMRQFLARALNEEEKGMKYANSKTFDGIKRWWNPYNKDARSVVETANSIDRRFQKMYLVDLPPEAALAKYTTDLKFTDDELRALQNQSSDTGAQLQEARRDMGRLFGQEVSITEPLPEAQIRVREIAKRVKETQSTADEAQLTTTSERTMDVIDEVVGKAMKRKDPSVKEMPVEAKHDVHLQIRYPQYHRETPQLRAKYLGVTEPRSPSNAQYDVKSAWNVDVTYTVPVTRKRQVEVTENGVKKLDANGQAVTKMEEYESTATVTKSFEVEREDVLKIRYEEVLESKVDPETHMSDLPALPTPDANRFPGISSSEVQGFDIVEVHANRASKTASNNVGSLHIPWHDEARVGQIFSQGGGARKSETPYRELIAHATNLTDGLTNKVYQDALKAGRTKQILSSLRAEEKALRDSREKLIEYHAKSGDAIQAQWSNDKVQDFKDRNAEMIARFDHMIKRVVHLAEQVNRETPSLEIQYRLQDYSDPLNRLDAKAARVKKQKIVGGSVIGGAAAAGTGYYFRDEIRALFDNGDRRRDRNR